MHEVKNFRKDGTTLYCSPVIKTKIILPDGKPGILSVSNDISEKMIAHQELISAKEKAEESDRVKSAFTCKYLMNSRTPPECHWFLRSDDRYRPQPGILFRTQTMF